MQAEAGPSSSSTASTMRRAVHICEAVLQELQEKASASPVPEQDRRLEEEYQAMLQMCMQTKGCLVEEDARARGDEQLCRHIEQLEEKRRHLRTLLQQYESEENAWHAAAAQLENLEFPDPQPLSAEEACASLTPEERAFISDSAVKRLVNGASQTQLALELQLDQLMMAAKNFERVRCKADKYLDAAAKAINERAFAHMPHIDDPRAMIRGMLGRAAPASGGPGAVSV
eukprot:tig00000605_g2496.t1